jgi:hypothetical protein
MDAREWSGVNSCLYDISILIPRRWLTVVKRNDIERNDLATIIQCNDNGQVDVICTGVPVMNAKYLISRKLRMLCEQICACGPLAGRGMMIIFVPQCIYENGLEVAVIYGARMSKPLAAPTGVGV